MSRAAGLILAAFCVVTACQQASSPPVARRSAIPDSADQVLFGIRFFLTDAGVRRAELHGDTAFMYDDNTRTEMRNVKTTFFKNTGEPDATLTSKQGTYNVRLGSMEARGDVVVIGTDGRRLTSPQLRYDPQRNQVSSDSAFTLTETNGRVIQGIGFTSDPDLNNVHIAKGAKAMGNEITIPRR